MRTFCIHAATLVLALGIGKLFAADQASDIDIRSKLASIEKELSADKRLPAQRNLLLKLGEERLDLLPKIYNVMPKAEAEAIVSELCAVWVRKDAWAITRYAISLPEGTVRNAILSDLAVSLTRATRFEDAKAVFGHLPASINRETVIANMTGNFSGRDNRELLTWAAGLSDSEARAAFRSMAGKCRLNRDVAGLQLLLAHAPVALRSELAHVMGKVVGKMGVARIDEQAERANLQARERQNLWIGSLGVASLEDAPKLIERILNSPDVELRRQGFQEYIGRLCYLDRGKAIAAAQQAPKELRFVGFWALVGKWHYLEPKSLTLWIDALPSGPDRDACLKALAITLRLSDKAKAVETARRIEDPEIRGEVLVSLEN